MYYLVFPALSGGHDRWLHMNHALENADEAAVLDIVDGDATKSDKIRRLDRLGLARADIARALDIRYQFVRNVLVEDERRRASRREGSTPDGRPSLPRNPVFATEADRKYATGADRMPAAEMDRRSAVGPAGHGSGGTGEADPAASAVRDASSGEALGPVRITLRRGRLAIPEPFLAALGIEDEDDVFLDVEQDEIRIYSRATALRQVQERVAKYVPSDVSLVDTLIEERRREALKEEAGNG